MGNEGSGLTRIPMEKYSRSDEPLIQFVYQHINQGQKRTAAEAGLGSASASRNSTNNTDDSIQSPTGQPDQEESAAEHNYHGPPTKRLKEWTEVLECPVCRDLPRPGAIYNCHNGHFICSGCKEKVDHCPVCRNKDLSCRNLIAEKLYSEAVKDIPLGCKNKALGCKYTALVDTLVKHERGCPFREVKCPAHHRNVCKWSGPFVDFFRHLKNSECCQVLRPTKVNDGSDKIKVAVFHGGIGEFPPDQPSVFKRTTGLMHWKPIMLFPQGSLHLANFMVYGVIRRKNASQTWTITMRAMRPQEDCDKMIVDLKVHGDKEKAPGMMFCLRSPVISHEMSEEEAIATGRYLTLTDDMVKALKKDNILLRYSASLINFQGDVDEDVFISKVRILRPENENGTAANAATAPANPNEVDA